LSFVQQAVHKDFVSASDDRQTMQSGGITTWSRLLPKSATNALAVGFIGPS